MDYLYSTPSLKRRLLTGLWRRKWALLVFASGCYLLLASGYIHGKALLAQWLIEDAWQVSLQRNEPVAPWSWADTYPVARLTIQGQHLYVLSGSSGTVLAFGPGHMIDTSVPGEKGNAVISGHRDTHFAVLQHLSRGDVLKTQTHQIEAEYEVTGARIVHQSQMNVSQNTAHSQLTLITCYPFDNPLPNTPWRYVVSARLISSQADEPATVSIGT